MFLTNRGTSEYYFPYTQIRAVAHVMIITYHEILTATTITARLWGLPHERLDNADNDNDDDNGGGGGDDDGDGDGGGNYNDDRGQPQTRNLTTTVNRLNFFKTCI